MLSQQPVAQFWVVHDVPAPLLLVEPLPLPPLLPVEPPDWTVDPSSAVPYELPDELAVAEPPLEPPALESAAPSWKPL